MDSDQKQTGKTHSKRYGEYSNETWPLEAFEVGCKNGSKQANAGIVKAPVGDGDQSAGHISIDTNSNT